MSLWLDWAKRNVAPVTGGSYSEGRMKLLVHTTETSVFRPDSSKYYGHTGWPHLTNERDGTMWQHIDLDIAARALKNAPGGVQTNRSRVVQVENVAYSKDGNNALTDAQIENLRRLVVELHEKRGLELNFLPAGVIPNSARADAPQRMSTHEWRTFSGVIAHRHAPENDHWDSGAFDLSRLLPQTKAPVIEPEPQEDEELMKHGDTGPQVAQLRHLVNRVISQTGGGFDHLPITETYDDELANRVWHAIARVEQWVLFHPVYSNSNAGKYVTAQTQAWLTNVSTALTSGALQVARERRITIDDRFEPLNPG